MYTGDLRLGKTQTWEKQDVMAAFKEFDGKVQQLLSYGSRTYNKKLRGMTPYDLALREV